MDVTMRNQFAAGLLGSFSTAPEDKAIAQGIQAKVDMLDVELEDSREAHLSTLRKKAKESKDTEEKNALKRRIKMLEKKWYGEA